MPPIKIFTKHIHRFELKDNIFEEGKHVEQERRTWRRRTRRRTCKRIMRETMSRTKVMSENEKCEKRK